VTGDVIEIEKTRIKLFDAWGDAKGLIIAHRSRLALGALLMLIARLFGLVLPASSASGDRPRVAG